MRIAHWSNQFRLSAPENLQPWGTITMTLLEKWVKRMVTWKQNVSQSFYFSDLIWWCSKHTRRERKKRKESAPTQMKALLKRRSHSHAPQSRLSGLQPVIPEALLASSTSQTWNQEENVEDRHSFCLSLGHRQRKRTSGDVHRRFMQNNMWRNDLKYRTRKRVKS